MSIVTRFAPSPTGFLHIGGARTALFCWLFARHYKGTFRLRIEDTDRERSTQGATDAILEGMKWLGLEWDDEVVFQFARAPRHTEVVNELLKNGHAYHCYTSQAELAALREAGKSYDRRWRDSKETPPAGVKPVVRLKSPLQGEVVLRDHVRGEVHVPAGQLEDLVILRSDGTPTYNLAVVVDDHDMGVTHIIRGEDHLTNAAKQQVMYELLGWKVPEFAHIPLIHGPDGAKLSKRHGALGVEAYRDMGYLPEALRNYLLRLGWAHGDDEIISTKQAIEWFNLEGIGKSASRFDFVKLENLNGHYIRESDDAHLVELLQPFLVKDHPLKFKADANAILLKAMPGLKARAKTLKELAAASLFYIVEDFPAFAADPKYRHAKSDSVLASGRDLLAQLLPELDKQNDWHAEPLQNFAKSWAEAHGKKLGDIAQPLRVALTASTVSPGVFEVMEILSKNESLKRLRQT